MKVRHLDLNRRNNILKIKCNRLWIVFIINKMIVMMNSWINIKIVQVRIHMGMSMDMKIAN
jgi:hypothetical protein